MFTKNIIILLLVLFLTGCTSTNEPPSESLDSSTTLSPDDALEDEIPEEEVKDEVKEEVIHYDFNTIVSAIDEVKNTYNDNIAIYYYNLNTQDEYFVNQDTPFVSASLKKLPLVMQVLDKVHAGELTLDTEIAYNSYSDYSNGTGTLQFEAVIGSRKVQELIDLSILESDNIAYKMLNRYCDYSLVEYMRYLTEDNSIVDEEYVKLTAKQTFKILHKLYLNEDNNPYYSHVINLLTKTAFNDRLDKYLPHDKVAHKIGSYFRYYHDAGIIFGKEDYILIALSKDIGTLTDDPQFLPNEEERYVVDMGDEACEVIAQLSKTIYDIINNTDSNLSEN